MEILNSLQKNEYLTYLTGVFDRIDFFFCVLTDSSGIILNSIALYVFSRPNLNKTTMGFFYMNLSAWCILCLFYSILVQNSEKTIGFDLTNLSEKGCAIYMLVRRTIREMPAWIEVIITIDTYLAICYPYKFKFMRNKLFLFGLFKATLVVLGFLNFENLDYRLIYSYKNITILNQTTNINSTQRVISSVVCYNISNGLVFAELMSALLRGFIPATVMLIFSIFLIRKVLESKKKLQMGSNKTDKSSVQFTRCVLNMNLIFWILNVPQSILYVVKSFIGLISPDPNVIAMILNIYIFINDIANLYYSSRFFCFLIFNKLFYKEILIILKLDKQQHNSTNKVTKETK